MVVRASPWLRISSYLMVVIVQAFAFHPLEDIDVTYSSGDSCHLTCLPINAECPGINILKLKCTNDNTTLKLLCNSSNQQQFGNDCTAEFYNKNNLTFAVDATCEGAICDICSNGNSSLTCFWNETIFAVNKIGGKPEARWKFCKNHTKDQCFADNKSEEKNSTDGFHEQGENNIDTLLKSYRGKLEELDRNISTLNCSELLKFQESIQQSEGMMGDLLDVLSSSEGSNYTFQHHGKRLDLTAVTKAKFNESFTLPQNLSSQNISQATILLPPGSIPENNSTEGWFSVATVFFKQIDCKNLSLSPNSNAANGRDSQSLLVSPIISLIAKAGKNSKAIKALRKPAILTFPTEVKSGRRCVFMYTVGNWSSEGLTVNGTNDTHTVCYTNHFSSFAVFSAVADFSGQAANKPGHEGEEDILTTLLKSFIKQLGDLDRNISALNTSDPRLSFEFQKAIQQSEGPMEGILDVLSSTKGSDTAFQYNGSNLDLYAVTKAKLNESFTLPHNLSSRNIIPRTTVSLPPGSLPEDNSTEGWYSVATIFFKQIAEKVKISTKNETSNERDNEISLVSPVISLVAKVGKTKKTIKALRRPVILTFPAQVKSQPRCAFMYTVGNWSSEGLTVNVTNDTYTVCHTNHFTSFAVLIDVHGQATEKLNDKDVLALDLITYIGSGFALLCLVICIVTFSCVRTLSAIRYKIHLHLCIVLAVAQLVFLVGVDRVENRNACIAVAVLLYYLLTASFTWMLVEATHLFIKVVTVFDTQRIKMRYYIALGWGLPALIVGVSSAVHPDGYVTKEPRVCWLSIQDNSMWVFVGPVIFVLVINLFVLISVVFVLAKIDDNPNEARAMKRARTAAKSIVVLFPMLGLSWLFGLLGMLTNKKYFLYIFVLLTSAQGIFLLLFQCIGNGEVRESLYSIKARHRMKYNVKREQKNRFHMEKKILNSNGDANNSSHDKDPDHLKPLTDRMRLTYSGTLGTEKLAC